MSQGYIGYHLQQGIKRELRIQRMPWHVATVVTQVEVAADDPAFADPTKPIGGFYDEDAARASWRRTPAGLAEDSGRGWRRLVPSPRPIDIVERDSILNLLDHEFIVIACGGGGVPVVRHRDGDYRGVPAVIDKDFASAKLAEAVGADYLFILTAVDKVSLNWGRPDRRDLDDLDADTARGTSTGPLRRRLDAAQGAGRSGVRPQRHRPPRGDLLTGQGPAGHDRQERHRHPRLETRPDPSRPGPPRPGRPRPAASFAAPQRGSWPPRPGAPPDR